MKVDVPMRRTMLGIALFLTLGATAYGWIDDQKPDALEVVTAVRETQEPARIVPVAQIAKTAAEKLPGRMLLEVDRDIFSVLGKEPEPEPEPQKIAVPTSATPIISQPLPVSPPLPIAPILPFTYIGKLGESGQYTVFVSARGKNYAVKAGETVAQLYRIEEIRPPLMTVTYLPMNIKQTLPIGEID
jgi:hypothetical protein